MKKLLTLLAAGLLFGGIVAGCGAKEEGDVTATPETTKPAPEKPADDKAAAEGTNGTTGAAPTDAGKTGTTPEKPADDKAAAEAPKSDK